MSKKKKTYTFLLDEKTGKMAVDYDGFVGDECILAAKEVLEMLGELGVQIEVETVKRKEEAKNEPVNNHWAKREQ